jgi:hypothetical protein
MLWFQRSIGSSKFEVRCSMFDVRCSMFSQPLAPPVSLSRLRGYKHRPLRRCLPCPPRFPFTSVDPLKPPVEDRSQSVHPRAVPRLE